MGVSQTRPRWIRGWLLPMFFLGGSALILFGAAYVIDDRLAGGSGISSAVQRFIAFDADKITDAISQLSPVVVALLGIVITVVAIIVQLSSNRYSGVARMFVRDRTNQAVLAYYVVAAVSGVWLSVALQDGFVPRVSLLLGIVFAALGMLLMLPYFAYVFWFLEPANLVARIRADATRSVEAAIRRPDAAATEMGLRQSRALAALAELTDIANHSLADKDKMIASRAVDALKDFACDYVERKPELPESWFTIGQSLSQNPDFIAMDSESLGQLSKRRTWVEWQVLRQYLAVYAEAGTSLGGVNYLIAIDTRYIGEAALRMGDDRLIELVFRYMNSYLRLTLNQRDVRTAYNVLNQYRLLAESMLRHGRDEFALDAVRHMGYYSHVSFDLTLNFVTETVAYDVSALCQAAHEFDSVAQDAMLALFLKLDRPLRMKKQERALLGVRKAQAKLGAYYLTAGEQARARMVARDLCEENDERITIIRAELEQVADKDFWEIIDRGHTFEYMPAEQRARLPEFFRLIDGMREDMPD